MLGVLRKHLAESTGKRAHRTQPGQNTASFPTLHAAEKKFQWQASLRCECWGPSLFMTSFHWEMFFLRVFFFFFLPRELL